MDAWMNQIDTIRQQLLEKISSSRPTQLFHPIATQNLANYIDHTLLKPEATLEQILHLCDEAKKHALYAVCVHPSYILQASQILQGSLVKPITVVGFPTGASTTETKVFETLDAIDNGAQEIDMVLHLGKLKSGRLEEVYQDILSVALQADQIPMKVIIETSKLTLEEKIQACILSQMAGATFVKTSTGFSEHGATVEDIRLMKAVVGQSMGVKASGGIKDLQMAQQMIQAGADRIGTSSSVLIIEESKR